MMRRTRKRCLIMVSGILRVTVIVR